MATSTDTLRLWWAPACKGPWAIVALYGNGSVQVRPAIVEATKALSQVLKAWSYETREADTGAYNCRPITGGTGYSLHAYGIALDINWLTNKYGSTLVTDMPLAMVNAIQAIRTNNGKQVWRSGRFYEGNKDAMHYEIVCSPADIATGINWGTVKGSVVVPAAPEGEEAVYRIYWFKSGTNPLAAYRVLCARAEKNTSKDPHLVVSGWWIKDMTELKKWHDRGLKDFGPSAPKTPSTGIQLFNGPYDNTKTF